LSTIYNNQKFLQFPDRIQALREGRVLAPVHIRIKPVNKCNHDCWYCAYRVSNLQLGEDMDHDDVIPADKMAQIVDDVIDMGVKAVTFSGGGEPLLYKQLPETIRNLAAGGIRIGALSNGSNLKGKVADAFAEYGTWIRISLDGWDDESYAKARDIKEGAFTQLIENLRSFSSRSSKCTLGTSFIIDNNNYSHIFEVCAQLKDAGVQHVKLYGVIINNDGRKNNAYHHRIARETMALIEKAKTLESDKFSIVNHYHLLEDRFEKTYTTCPFLTYLTIIGADSNVYTCQDKAYNKDGLLGSIKDRSFKNFWFSEENKQRMNAVNPSEMCKHHCVSNEKNLTLIEHLSLDEDHVTFV
jgi:MoaA/NifB/PqqE/SkfB family radical SAM enzyme